MHRWNYCDFFFWDLLTVFLGSKIPFLEKVLLEIEKILITFSIFDKKFSKTDSLIYALKGYVWGISRTGYLSALGSQARTILFSNDISFLLKFDLFLGSLWILSYISKKCAPRMPYKLLGKGMVYHYYTCVVVAEACLALRRGNKTMRVSRPKVKNPENPQSRQKLEKGTVPQKRFFVGEDFVPTPQACMEVQDFHLWPRACLVAILAWHLCPTSAKDAPHSWLISPIRKEKK